MNLLDKRSLAETLDRVNEAVFFGREIPQSEASRVALWLAGRQGRTGSYANMFAPTPQDFDSGFRLFTGERITTRAATGHILGEETCRVLRLLDVNTSEVTGALARAGKSMDKCLAEFEDGSGEVGFF